MKKSLVLFAVVAIAIGTITAFATDKKASAASDSTTAPAATATVAKKVQTLCPECGNQIQKKFYAESDGKRVYCCSSFCADKVKKDVANVIKKLESAGITLDAAGNDKKTDKKTDKKKKKTTH